MTRRIDDWEIDDSQIDDGTILPLGTNNLRRWQVSDDQQVLESSHTPATSDLLQQREGSLPAAKPAGGPDPRKDLFLATLAHEMRNPLAAISNALHVWRRVKCDPAAMEEIQDLMERQVKHISRLCEDLLDVSRIAQGKLEIRRHEVELRALVIAAVETVRPFITSCDHELTVALPKRPLFIEGDDTRLIQVFVNLIHNAAKYTGQKGHVWVSAERQGESAVVCVRDNGPGIPHALSHLRDVHAAGSARIMSTPMRKATLTARATGLGGRTCCGGCLSTGC